MFFKNIQQKHRESRKNIGAIQLQIYLSFVSVNLD